MATALTMEEMEQLQGKSGARPLTMEEMDGMATETRLQGRNPFYDTVLPLSSKYGVNPDFVDRIMHQESVYNPRATSPKGAMGLMQLMPGTAKDMGVKNPYHPEENIEGGIKYLRMLQDRFGNNPTVIAAAYNAGPERAQAWIDNKADLPKETKNYIAKVTGIPWAELRSKGPLGELPPMVGSMAGMAAKTWKAGAPLAFAGAAGANLIQQAGKQGAIPEDAIGPIIRGEGFEPLVPGPVDIDLEQAGRVGLDYAAGETVGRGMMGLAGKILGPASRMMRGAEPEVEQAFKPYVQQAMQQESGAIGQPNVPGFSLRQRVRSNLYGALDEIAQKAFGGNQRLTDYYRAQRVAGQNFAKDAVGAFWDEAGGTMGPQELQGLFTNFRDAAEKSFRDSASVLYSRVDATGKGVTVDMKDTIKRLAAELQSKADLYGKIGGSEAGDALLAKVQNLPDQMTFSQAHQLRSRLLEEISNFEDKAKGKRIATILEQQVDTAMERAATGLDEPLLPMWRDANKYYKEGMNTFKNEWITKFSEQVRKNPERVVDALKDGNLATLDAFQKVMKTAPEGQKVEAAVRARWAEDLFASADRTVQASDVSVPLGTRVANNLRSYDDAWLQKWLRPDQRASLEKVVSALRTSQSADRFMSPTGRAVYITGQIAGVGSAATGAYVDDDPLRRTGYAISGTSLLVAPWLAGRMAVSPLASKVLVDGFTKKFSPGSSQAAGLAGRMAAAAYRLSQDDDEL